jgi:hypothetical protein
VGDYTLWNQGAFDDLHFWYVAECHLGNYSILGIQKAEQQLGEYDKNDQDKLGCPWKGCAS